MSSLLMLSLVLLYVIVALCLAPIACVLCCSCWCLQREYWQQTAVKELHKIIVGKSINIW